MPKQLFTRNQQLAIFFLLFLFLSGSFFYGEGNKTFNDSEYLKNNNKPQVLGVKETNNDLENNHCPVDKPVIGWIDYQGNKKIIDKLEKDQNPIICFESVEEAKNLGFKQ